MKTLLVLVLLLPFGAGAQNYSTRTLPLNTPIYEDKAILCFDKNAAIDLANSLVKRGLEAFDRQLRAHKERRLCIEHPAFVVYTNQFHRAEADNGFFMNVFQGDLLGVDGVKIYSPQSWTIEDVRTFDCRALKETTCI